MVGIVVGSANALIGIGDALEVLRAGGTAVDAVIAGVEPVEANPEDHSVGFAGLPNLVGEVELDASIMDGRTLATGAVGALQGYAEAIALARKVMDELPHNFLVGAGARRFASETGFQPRDLLTEEAKRIWRGRLEHVVPGEPLDPFMTRVRDMVESVARDPELPDVHGTVNVIARDRRGHIACGVSTSGWAWKYPGRLGDSPVIGAGNYADDRWGAAACTGRGEMAARCVTAHSVVTFMRCGMDLQEAVLTAMADLTSLPDIYASEVNVIAIDCEGNHLGASTSGGKTYVFQREDMDGPEVAPRLHVPY